MKLLKTSLVVAAFAAVLASATSTFAAPTATKPAKSAAGKPGKPSRPAPPDSATVVSFITAEYAKVAPYDLNVNGQLEASEQELLAAAITAGTVTFTPPDGRTPPADFTPPPSEDVAAHVAEMYAKIAPYDVNVNGVLDTDEQSALKTAIESGLLPGPGHKGHHGRKGDSTTATS